MTGIEEKLIEVPDHLSDCKCCSTLYKLLVRAYAPDHGADFDADAGQELLCDRCGVTACSIYGCTCEDVLCPHGRRHLRESSPRPRVGHAEWRPTSAEWDALVTSLRDQTGIPKANIEQLLKTLQGRLWGPR
jgi:hypothetical protein